jgi:hypothetical protein
MTMVPWTRSEGSDDDAACERLLHAITIRQLLGAPSHKADVERDQGTRTWTQAQLDSRRLAKGQRK